MNNLNKFYKECYNLIQNKELIFYKLLIKFIILNQNNNLKKNLIFKKEIFQDKVLLELLKNVKINLMKYFMQLNILNNQKIKQILLNYKQDNK